MGEQSWWPRGTAVSDSRCAKVSSSPGWEEICLEYQFCQLCETKTKQKKKKKVNKRTNKKHFWEFYVIFGDRDVAT